MRKLLGIVLINLLLLTPFVHAAKLVKTQSAQKERLVLMPLRVAEEDKGLLGNMETALVQGLQQKYEVFSGEQVAQKARAIFLKESKAAANKGCDETRCMQDIAEAFQAELIATANVNKRPDGYFLALSVQNIFDNKVVYSNSVACKSCDAYQVVDNLKELSGTILQASAPTADTRSPPAIIGNPNNPENSLWVEVQKDNSVDDYNAYLARYPKGKYVALAKTRIKKLQEQEAAEARKQKAEAAGEAVRQEQGAWESANNTASEESYAEYLSSYPRGQYATLATARIAKFKKEAAILAAQAPKAPKPGKTFKDCADCPEMIVLPAGSFDMGSNNGMPDEMPVHRVSISKPFAMGKTEITRGQFAAFVSATNYDAGTSTGCRVYSTDRREVIGSDWRNPSYSQNDSHPVVCINWSDAQAYTAWLTRKTGKQYRLPSEVEWEYACRAGGRHEYCGGSDINSVAWYNSNSSNTTHPVAQKQANTFGLFDMSGNVWEWVEDSYHENYVGAPTDGSVWLGDGTQRVLRGGSWGFNPQNSRAAIRGMFEPARRDKYYGFRLVRILP